MMGVLQITSKIKLFVLAVLFVLASAKHEEYAGWKSYYINTSTTEQVKKLNAIRTRLDLDFLSPAHVKREAVVLVKPEHHEEFIKNLDHLCIKYKIHVDDVKLALDHDDELNRNKIKAIGRDGDDKMSYDDYQDLETINTYMAYIAAEYPITTTLVTAANSFEGRPIRYMKISTTNFEDKSKPVIFVDGGLHAREWIAPPTVTWAIKKLTEDVTEPELLNHFDWILMPIVNPDGYYFSFNGSRLWRKNRSRNYPNDLICPGVDGNRNFNIKWNSTDTSGDPCSVVYGGTRPFSEIETKVIRNILLEHLPRIALYMSMHSYGSFILHSWAYNYTLSYNYDNLTEVGFAIADAFLTSPSDFPPFVVGSTAEVLYSCSGNSVDYAHYIGVALAYTIELPGFKPKLRNDVTSGEIAVKRKPINSKKKKKKKKDDGFHLEPQYIKDVCRGTWAGIVVGAKRATMIFRESVQETDSYG